MEAKRFAAPGRRTTVTLARLEQKLGPNAFVLLDFLWSKRLEDGYVHVPLTAAGTDDRGRRRMATIARLGRKLSPRLVTLALARLRKAGLVEAPRRSKVEDADGRVTWTYMRRVWGVEDGASALVPLETDAWLETASDGGRGGKRPKAHRLTAEELSMVNRANRAKRTSKPTGKAKPKPPTQREQGLDDGGADDIDRAEKARVRGLRAMSVQVTGNVRRGNGQWCNPKRKKKISSSKALVGANAPPRAPAAPDPSEVSELDVEELGGDVSPLAVANYRDLPRFPDVKPARVPLPPLLRDDMSDDDAAELLVRLYRNAYAARTGRPPFSLVVGGEMVQRMLLRAVALMREHEVAPAAWIAWSFDVWRDHVAKSKRPPTMPWTFAAGRLEKRQGWFRGDRYATLGGTGVVGDRLRDLRLRWFALRREVGLLPAGSSAVADAVSRAFPEGYEAAYRAAQVEADSMHKRLVAARDDGVWLWGR